MKADFFFTRIFTFFLSLSLILPPPALGLRQTGLEESKQRESLEEKLLQEGKLLKGGPSTGLEEGALVVLQPEHPKFKELYERIFGPDRSEEEMAQAIFDYVVGLSPKLKVLIRVVPETPEQAEMLARLGLVPLADVTTLWPSLKKQLQWPPSITERAISFHLTPLPVTGPPDPLTLETVAFFSPEAGQTLESAPITETFKKEVQVLQLWDRKQKVQVNPSQFSDSLSTYLAQRRLQLVGIPYGLPDEEAKGYFLWALEEILDKGPLPSERIASELEAQALTQEADAQQRRSRMDQWVKRFKKEVDWEAIRNDLSRGLEVIRPFMDETEVAGIAQRIEQLQPERLIQRVSPASDQKESEVLEKARAELEKEQRSIVAALAHLITQPVVRSAELHRAVLKLIENFPQLLGPLHLAEDPEAARRKVLQQYFQIFSNPRVQEIGWNPMAVVIFMEKLSEDLAKVRQQHPELPWYSFVLLQADPENHEVVKLVWLGSPQESGLVLNLLAPGRELARVLDYAPLFALGTLAKVLLFDDPTLRTGEKIEKIPTDQYSAEGFLEKSEERMMIKEGNLLQRIAEGLPDHPWLEVVSPRPEMKEHASQSPFLALWQRPFPEWQGLTVVDLVAYRIALLLAQDRSEGYRLLLRDVEINLENARKHSVEQKATLIALELISEKWEKLTLPVREGILQQMAKAMKVLSTLAHFQALLSLLPDAEQPLRLEGVAEEFIQFLNRLKEVLPGEFVSLSSRIRADWRLTYDETVKDYTAVVQGLRLRPGPANPPIAPAHPEPVAGGADSLTASPSTGLRAGLEERSGPRVKNYGQLADWIARNSGLPLTGLPEDSPLNRLKSIENYQGVEGVYQLSQEIQDAIDQGFLRFEAITNTGINPQMLQRELSRRGMKWFRPAWLSRGTYFSVSGELDTQSQDYQGMEGLVKVARKFRLSPVLVWRQFHESFGERLSWPRTSREVITFTEALIKEPSGSPSAPSTLDRIQQLRRWLLEGNLSSGSLELLQVREELMRRFKLNNSRPVQIQILMTLIEEVRRRRQEMPPPMSRFPTRVIRYDAVREFVTWATSQSAFQRVQETLTSLNEDSDARSRIPELYGTLAWLADVTRGAGWGWESQVEKLQRLVKQVIENLAKKWGLADLALPRIAAVSHEMARDNPRLQGLIGQPVPIGKVWFVIVPSDPEQIRELSLKLIGQFPKEMRTSITVQGYGAPDDEAIALLEKETGTPAAGFTVLGRRPLIGSLWVERFREIIANLAGVEPDAIDPEDLAALVFAVLA